MFPIARLLASWLLAGTVPPAADAAPPAVPRFERTTCAAEVAADERIECGELVVAENRRRPDSRAIRLPVIVFRSRAAAPAPDPVLYMAGGPGNSATAGRRSGRDIPFLDDRDYVVLEQRGARRARPALECPAINALRGEIAAGRVHGDTERSAMAKEAAACRAALVGAGADLDGYTSAATADDVDDLRQALGYERWNLYGISYSTRLMLTVLRRHPGGVRSLVLDSVLPPDVNFDEVASANLLRALHGVFDGCAIDRECAAAYPDLERRFAALVAGADREPLALPPDAADASPVVARGAVVVDAIYAALHQPRMIPLLPRVIGEAAAGRYELLAPLVRENQGPSSFTWGMRLSVWCAEEIPFERPDRIAAQLSPSLGLGGIDETGGSPEVCRAWGVAAAPAVENEPVRSDVRALVFAGEFDPDTPPDWGRQLLETMPNARFVELRGRSHGAAFSPCGAEIAAAFLRSPGAPLPVECALTLRGADFGLSARPRP